MQFGKFEYLKAQEFLKDAKKFMDHSHIWTHSPTFSVRYWQKPDGGIWREDECHLEYPEDSYSLEEVSLVRDNL